MGLERFIDAQDRPHGGYADALAEIRRGAKTGHWIWYVFPQLYGLGTSSHSRAYGIRGVVEATEYVQDPVLRARLIEIAAAVAAQLDRGVAVEQLMGSPIDGFKLVSSLTLLGGVARRLACEDPSFEFERLATIADAILARAQAEGYPPCERSAAALAQEPAAGMGD